jgi:phosphoribosylformylglycinamidine synthase
MVGQVPEAAGTGRLGFAREGDAIAIVGDFAPSLAGSELAKLRGEAPAGPLPELDVPALRAAHAAVRGAVREGRLRSAHDIAEGGIAVALAECCVAGGVGAAVDHPGVELFGEAPGRAFVVSGDEDAVTSIEGARVIGVVAGSRLRIGDTVDVAVEKLRAARDGGLRL